MTFEIKIQVDLKLEKFWILIFFFIKKYFWRVPTLNPNYSSSKRNDIIYICIHKVIIKDESVFKLVSVQSPSAIASQNNAHPVKDSCAVIVLDALKVGRTTIKVNTLAFTPSSTAQPSPIVHLNSNELLIGSYSQLKSFKTQLVLSEDSSSVIDLFDGPLLSTNSDDSNRVNVNLKITFIISFKFCISFFFAFIFVEEPYRVFQLLQSVFLHRR